MITYRVSPPIKCPLSSPACNELLCILILLTAVWNLWNEIHLIGDYDDEWDFCVNRIQRQAIKFIEEVVNVLHYRNFWSLKYNWGMFHVIMTMYGLYHPKYLNAWECYCRWGVVRLISFSVWRRKWSCVLGLCKIFLIASRDSLSSLCSRCASRMEAEGNRLFWIFISLLCCSFHQSRNKSLPPIPSLPSELSVFLSSAELLGIIVSILQDYHVPVFEVRLQDSCRRRRYTTTISPIDGTLMNQSVRSFCTLIYAAWI